MNEIIAWSIVCLRQSKNDANVCTLNPPLSDGEGELRDDSTEIANPAICDVANQLGADPDSGSVQVEIDPDHLTGIDQPDIQIFKIEPKNLPGLTFVGQHKGDA